MTENDDRKLDSSNHDIFDPSGLRMGPERARRFSSVLSQIARAIHSLDVAAEHFKGLDVSNGQMDPCATIRAFSNTMGKDINLVFSMLNNEEREVGNA